MQRTSVLLVAILSTAACEENGEGHGDTDGANDGTETGTATGDTTGASSADDDPDGSTDADGDDGESTSTGSNGGSSCGSTCDGPVAQENDSMCWCDPVCEARSDCCDDYVAICGDGECSSNDDCGADQVCRATTHVCADIYKQTYDLYVEAWQDTSDVCWDGVGNDCLADVYYIVTRDGTDEYQSSQIDDAKEASWYDPAGLDLVSDTRIMIDFYDADTSAGDRFMSKFCWASGSACAGVPDHVLHDGWDQGAEFSGETMDVTIRLVAR